MLSKWRERIKGMFSSDAPEEETDVTPRKKAEQGHTEQIGARVIYQYPKERPFRFPVIPDETDETDEANAASLPERPTRRERRLDIIEPKEEAEERGSRKIIPETRQRFVPTRVPSPIYGFNERRPERKIEEVPAFIRKEAADQAPPAEAKLEPVEQPEQEPTPSVDVAPEQPERVLDEAGAQRRTDEAKPDALQAEEVVPAEPVPKQQPETRVQPKRKQRQRKRSSGQSDVTPFNVIMTPRDRKRLMDQEKAKARAAAEAERAEASQRDEPVAQEVLEAYEIPYHLLNDPVTSSSEDQLWVENQQVLLEQTLSRFNVEAEVVQSTQGPSVTRFEIQPSADTRVSKIRSLSDDIKLNMSARDIRIEAPIPGKNTVGIEIPNLQAQPVGLQEILQTESFQASESPLTIGLGLTVEGRPLVTNIAKMPHGLIAGATGSGKSVCINTILISLIYKSSYHDVKFLLIDPKMVELAPYNGIPHLVAPVITDIKAATAALKWAVTEMEARYEKFVVERVRDISRYNEKVTKEGRHDEKMPFLVIVIDELADLMMMSPQDVEEAICRIAQKARACGIHLLLATQRPSVDVITGLIKANIPTRIAFSVTSQVDSRTIIDAGGADRLLGKGDMLFIENGSGDHVRLQGPFVSDEEIERVTNHVRTLAEPVYLFEQAELLAQIETDEAEDDLFPDVLEFILEQGSASTSLVQRQFRIGYNRAARLIDSLEQHGVISEQNGSRPRDVLLSRSQVEEIL